MFLVEVLLLLIIFLVGCAAAAGACAAYISTEAERGTGYSFFLLRFCRLQCAAMLPTSIAAVVLGCFSFSPLDCDASVMVVDCAAVETGYMLEKNIKVFFSVSATTIFFCVYSIAVAAVEKGYAFLFFGRGAAAYNISTEAERGTGYCFFLLRFCPLHCYASDVYCSCCSWLLLFLSFRLRCFGYGC